MTTTVGTAEGQRVRGERDEGGGGERGERVVCRQGADRLVEVVLMFCLQSKLVSY